jgi:hypothetical protein
MAGRTWTEAQLVVDLIPKRYHQDGLLDLDQSIFKSDFAMRYLNGEGKSDAVDHATATRRESNPSFDPELDPGFWNP